MNNNNVVGLAIMLIATYVLWTILHPIGFGEKLATIGTGMFVGFLLVVIATTD